jgi:tripartite-type tricarboxylate transporter receptor subunit TctC
MNWLLSSRLRATGFVLAAVIGSGATALADPVSDFYTGKSISMIISAGAGGGFDTNARLVARHLGKHIPGHPTIVPRNMPGGGHLVAANYMYNVAPKDGTMLATLLPAFVSYQVLDGRQVEYDAAKFNWIGASDVDNMNMYVWHTANIHSIEDAKKTPVLMGATGAGSYTALFPTLLNNLIGTKFKIVSGYKSTNEIHIAMERGEVQGRAGNFFSSLTANNPDWLAEKKIDMLMQVGSKRDPDFKDVPLMTDLATNPDDKRILAIYSGDVALGRSFITTPGVPADRLAALRKAFDEMILDPEFLADAKKINMEVKPLGHVELTAAALEILSTPPELIEKAKQANAPAKN